MMLAMAYHKIAAGFIILFTLAACQSGNRLNPSFLSSRLTQAEKPLLSSPPPSPRAASDLANLPKGARSLSDSVFLPLENHISVALLLPLTGAHAALGKDLQNAAQLALFDIQNDKLRILPMDTQGTPQGAIAAMNKAVAARADIVIGPLYSHEAAAIAPIAKAHSIPVVSFSNNTDLARQDIFVFGFMPQQQVYRVLEYALSRGIRDYYVIAPDDAFGKATLATFDLLKNRGEFTLHSTATYNTNTNQGMVEAARSIAKDILEQKKTAPTPRQRGLLVPEGGSKLLEISKLLSGFGLNANDVRLLGSGQWDDVALGHYKRLYGGWFATASPTQRNVFEKHFEQVYNYKPIRIASVAYDSIALVGFLSKNSDNTLATSAIINERGYAGVDGVFRFAPDHIAERNLAVLEVIPNGFEILDEAPKVFPSYSRE